MTLMAEVEHFYKSAEPSSPVPMLLARRADISNRDFSAILRDLMPAGLEGTAEGVIRRASAVSRNPFDKIVALGSHRPFT